ncbi:MAG: DUF4258 domain-containing protein [Phycisphaerales bacterium]
MSTPEEQRWELTASVIRGHALEQMSIRGITEEQVRHVLVDPETVMTVRPGRVVAQRMITTDATGRNAGDNMEYLFRVFVDIDRQPPEVVTAYRTSKIHKHRKKP